MNQWRENIRQVEPYTPGEQPKETGIVKLNTNENPYPPSPKVNEIHENLGDLRLYPDPTAGALVEAIAQYHNVDRSQVFVGVGSDDVLAMSFLTFFNSQKPILFPDITYSFYDVWAGLYRIPYETPALTEDFKIRKEDYYKENGGVIFPNPNAPTGIYENLTFVEDILKHNQDVVVIVDEAYIDFGGATALPLLEKYENLLVVRTFSKSRSMAGLRIGYAIGNQELIKALNDVKYSFNSYTMNLPSIRHLLRMNHISGKRQRKSWRPEAGLKVKCRNWDFLFRIPKQTLYLHLIRRYRLRRFLKQQRSIRFMSGTLQSQGLIIICGFRSVPEKKCRSC